MHWKILLSAVVILLMLGAASAFVWPGWARMVKEEHATAADIPWLSGQPTSSTMPLGELKAVSK